MKLTMRHLWRWLSRLWSSTAIEAAPPAPTEHEYFGPPAPTREQLAARQAARRKAWQKQVDRLEKLRRKHDHFVTPKGELPPREKKPLLVTQEIKPELPKPEPPPEPPAEPVELSDFGYGNIAEPHHEDRSEDVLFKVEEMFGEFNFRDTILEQLDRYFFYLKRMRQNDRDAYDLYRQVGATLLPYLATGSWNRTTKDDYDPKAPLPALPEWFNKLRPGFGCFAYGTDPETEKFEQASCEDKKREMWVPKFLYFVKYQLPPWTVQPMSGGDIYALTIWWDRPSKKMKHGIPQQLPIFISKDGKTIKALKILKTSYRRIRSKRSQFSVPSRQWQIPADYRRWAEDNHEEVQHFLTRVFIDAVAQSENSHMSMTRIAVTKDRMTAVFSVNINRTAYFFQDRDIEVTEKGTRARVFHVVRPHIRKDGTAVKMHFRGSRDFTWAGYRVHISVPGLDHVDITQIDVGAVDYGRVEKDERKKTISQKQWGAMMADWMEKGVGRPRRFG